MWQGFGDALAQAVGSRRHAPPAVPLSGWWLDGRLGTRPLFAIVLGLFGVVGVERARVLHVPGGHGSAKRRASRGHGSNPNVEREIALDIVTPRPDDRARRRAGRRAHPRLGRRGQCRDRARHRLRATSSLAARSLSGGPRRSRPAFVGGVAIGGYVRAPRRDPRRAGPAAPPRWIDLPILGFTLVGAHLGLLFWETKYVSMTLAAPGSPPPADRPDGDE